LAAAFIGWNETREIPTAFAEPGKRIGDQSGRYGAYIDEASVPQWAYASGFRNSQGQPVILNTYSPEPVGLPPDGTFVTSGRAIPATCLLFQGGYYWAVYGQVQVGCSSERVGDQRFAIIKKADSNCKVSLGSVVRLTEEQLKEATESYVPGKQWKPPRKCKCSLVSSRVQASWPYTKLSGHTYNELYDGAAIYQEVLRAARMLCNDANVKDLGDSYPQSVYTYDGSADKSLLAIPTLLNTFEFSDPQLALGLVGRSTHWQNVTDKNGCVVTRNGKPDGKPKRELVLRGGPYGTYVFEWLVQHAWYDAVSSIPQANQNSIQNLMAAFELLEAIRTGNVAEIPDALYGQWVEWTKSADNAAKAVANLWMGYRYEYSTTKMDIEEYISFGLNMVDRYMSQIVKSRTHGHASYQGYECNCSMSWEEKGLTGLSKFYHTLYESGLEPNAYVLWDFVPFSFVADWFGNVGDVLQVYSDSQYRNTQYYDFSDVVFSIRYSTGPIAGLTASHYVRWVATEPPPLEHEYWFDDGDATTGVGTKFKRVLDSGSLLSGFCLRR
jgi:hypothetical protein